MRQGIASSGSRPAVRYEVSERTASDGDVRHRILDGGVVTRTESARSDLLRHERMRSRAPNARAGSAHMSDIDRAGRSAAAEEDGVLVDKSRVAGAEIIGQAVHRRSGHLAGNHFLEALLALRAARWIRWRRRAGHQSRPEKKEWDAAHVRAP